MKPIRVWKYRGWCWICRRCAARPPALILTSHTSGWDAPSQRTALDLAERHWTETHP